jgi:hypothetical protein
MLRMLKMLKLYDWPRTATNCTMGGAPVSKEYDHHTDHNTTAADADSDDDTH